MNTTESFRSFEQFKERAGDVCRGVLGRIILTGLVQGAGVYGRWFAAGADRRATDRMYARHGTPERHEYVRDGLVGQLNGMFDVASRNGQLRQFDSAAGEYERLILDGEGDRPLTVIDRSGGEYDIHVYGPVTDDGNRTVRRTSTRLSPEGFLVTNTYERTGDHIVTALAADPCMNLLGGCDVYAPRASQPVDLNVTRGFGDVATSHAA